MKTICTATLIFISLTTSAQRYLLKNESVIFSFDTQSGKHILLARDKDNAYIVYRYGTTDSVEFEYPEKTRDSWKKLMGTNTAYMIPIMQYTISQQSA